MLTSSNMNCVERAMLFMDHIHPYIHDTGQWFFLSSFFVHGFKSSNENQRNIFNKIITDLFYQHQADAETRSPTPQEETHFCRRFQ